MKKFISVLTVVSVLTGSALSVYADDYTTDSAELEQTMEHYKTDDEDNFINNNLDEETQQILIDATNAVIDGTTAVTSDDAGIQVLIDLAEIAAEGGREAEVPAKVAEGIENGVTVDMMLASALLCTPYNGFPRTLNIMSAINSVAAETETTAEAESETAESTEPETENGSVIVVMQTGNTTMTVNGESKEIDPGAGTAPVTENRITFLPVSIIIDELGGTSQWLSDSKTVVISYGSDEISLAIGSTEAYVNGEAVVLDTAPVIINNRTMVPLNFIKESFGFDVQWDEDTETVTIIAESSNIDVS